MTINKTSIRNEIENIRSDFDKFAKKGSVPTEISVIVESLFKVVNILIVVLLEKQVRKNSSNSGLLPKGMSGPLQYGVGIRASIINFIIPFPKINSTFF